MDATLANIKSHIQKLAKYLMSLLWRLLHDPTIQLLMKEINQVNIDLQTYGLLWSDSVCDATGRLLPSKALLLQRKRTLTKQLADAINNHPLWNEIGDVWRAMMYWAMVYNMIKSSRNETDMLELSDYDPNAVFLALGRGDIGGAVAEFSRLFGSVGSIDQKPDLLFP